MDEIINLVSMLSVLSHACYCKAHLDRMEFALYIIMIITGPRLKTRN